MADANTIPAPPSKDYVPDEIILYGVELSQKIPGGIVGLISIGKHVDQEIKLNVGISKDHGAAKGEDYTIATIYGYAYEGHCYRMDKPSILVFLHGNSQEPAVGCGFDSREKRKDGSTYSMWRLRSPQEILQLEMTVGTLQTVVLDANLPGRRGPSTYAAHMQLAHRGGRLT
jgi:hypothetical protein